MILARLVAAEGRLWSLNARAWERYVTARVWGSLVQAMPKAKREAITKGARVVPFSRILKTHVCHEGNR